MRRTLLSLLMCFAMVSSLALAQTEDEHASHHPQGGPAPGAQAPAPRGQPASPPDAKSVQRAMTRLQDLMSRLEGSSDSAERASLLHEHMLAMLEQIKLTRSQASGMKMAMMNEMHAAAPDNGKEPPAMSQQESTDKPGGMKGRAMMSMHKTMEQRVDMLEQLLEQVIKHMHQQAADH